MGNELDLGGLVMRIRADATGVLEGARQLEAAWNQMRTSSDKAGSDIEKAAAREVTAVQGAANATTQAAQQVVQGNQQMAQSAEESSAVQAAAYAGVAAMATKMIGAVINAIDKGIEAQNRYINSMKGLQSVGDGRGIGSQELQGALDGLTDSFFDASAAATSLKNLLTRGYTLDQAIDTITRLKDSAAFGRQANLSLAQAVQTATEGIRNENSILVDNAGVTKNVAKMWEDYAKARGIATTSLTQAQKVEAEYQGIMQETALQVGDLSKLTDTLAGSQAKAAQSSELLSRSYGEEMAPAISLLTNGLTTFQDTLRGVVEMFPGFTAGMSAGGVALMALVVTIPAASIALKKIKADFAEATASATVFGMSLKTAMPLMAGISALILAGTWAWTAYKNAQEAAAKKEAEAAQKREENIRKASQTSAELVKLADRYDELSKKQRLSYSEMKELRIIEEQLTSQHTTTGEAVAKLTEKYDDLGKAARAAAAEEFNIAQGLQYEKMEKDLDAVTAAMKGFADARENAIKGEGILREDLSERNIVQTRIAGDWIKAYETQLALIKDTLTNWFASSLTYAANATVQNGASRDAVDLIGKDLTEQFGAMLDSTEFDPTQGGAGAFVDTMKAILKSFASVTSSPEYSAAVDVMTEMKDKYINGLAITADDETRLQAALETLANFGGDILSELNTNGLNDADANAWADKLISQIFGPFEDALPASGLITDIVKKFNDAIKLDFWDAFDNSSLEDKTAAFDGVAKSISELTTNFKGLATELSNMQAAQGALDWLSENGLQADGAKEMIALVDQYTGLTVKSNDDISQAYRYTGAEIDRLTKRHEDLNLRSDELIGTYERMADTLDTDATPALESLMNASAQADDALQAVTDQDLDALKTDFVGLGATIIALNERIQTTTKRAENLKEIKKIMSNNARSAAEWDQAMALLGLSTTATAEEAKQAVSDMESSLKAESTSIQDALNAAYNDLLAFVEAANAHPELNIDTSPAMAAIQALFAPLNTLLGLLGLAGVKPKGGGGGGTSRYQKDVASIDHESSMDRMSLERELAALEALDAKYRNRKGRSTLKLADQRDLEKRIYEAQEAIRQKDLDDAYDLIDHKKALNQLSLQEELAMLEAIKGAHKLNAEELLDIEERLYDVKESIRQQSLQAELDLYSHQKNMGELTVQQEIDTLERIKAAHQLNQQELWSLEEQLYALRKQLQDETLRLQEDALSTQSSAIQKAYNKITQALKNRLQEEKNAELKALDDKIAILQAETAAENEAAREQDYETKLAEKQRQLQITKSARERRVLQADIDKLIADEQLRQVQAARQTEIDALRDQKTAVNDKYAQLMDEENLRQEALRMVMSNNLQQMADLIASYGSVWEDAGASLADYLTKGITDGKTGILATLDGLVNGMNNAVERQFQQIANSIPDVRAGGIQINMNGLTVREEADVKRIAEAIMEEVERKSR